MSDQVEMHTKIEVWVTKETWQIFCALPLFSRMTGLQEEPEYPESRSVVTYIYEDYVLHGYQIDCGFENDISQNAVIKPNSMEKKAVRIGYL